MKDADSASLPASGADQNPATIAALADDIVTAMQQSKALPSLAVLVGCLEDLHDRLPHEFDEQLELLRSIRGSMITRLKKKGKSGLVRELGEILRSLEHCGEVPAYPFGVIIERLPHMEAYAAGRYLEGVMVLARKARYAGSERRLIALLGGVDDRDAPFAWSDRELELFRDVVKRYEANMAGALGIAPVVREGSSTAAYPIDASAPTAQLTPGKGSGKVRWASTVVTLVFIADALRKAGAIDPTMTDAEIIACCDYRSKSEKPDDVFRVLRRKLLKGSSHPRRDVLLTLIPMLLEHLSAEDQRAIKESIEAGLKPGGEKRESAS